MLLANCQGALVERLRLHKVAFVTLKHGQIVQAGRRVRMCWTELLLANGKNTPVQRLRFCIPPLRSIKDCQIIENICGAVVKRTEVLLPNSQDALVQLLCLDKIASISLEYSQVM